MTSSCGWSTPTTTPNPSSFATATSRDETASRTVSTPYKRLKTVLKADIDESAWATLYSTRSRPFAKPATGKIAVKVVNHYGDEVLKVYEV
jgi:hypothetical protein